MTIEGCGKCGLRRARLVHLGKQATREDNRLGAPTQETITAIRELKAEMKACKDGGHALGAEMTARAVDASHVTRGLKP